MDSICTNLNHDIDIYGCDTTAIVLGQMQKFFILNGNHSKILAEAALYGGLDACLTYFREREDEWNGLSEKPVDLIELLR